MKHNLSKGLAILLILCLLTCEVGAADNTTNPLPLKSPEVQAAEQAIREVFHLEHHHLIEDMLKYERDWTQWDRLGYITKELYKDEVDKGWIRLILFNGTNVYYHEFPALLYISEPVNLAFVLHRLNGASKEWIYDAQNKVYFNPNFTFDGQSKPYICEAIPTNIPGYRLDVDAALKYGTLRPMTIEEVAGYLKRIEKAGNAAEEFALWLPAIMVGEVDHVCKDIKECMDQYTKLRP